VSARDTEAVWLMLAHDLRELQATMEHARDELVAGGHWAELLKAAHVVGSL
jgi:hypothetical protein